METKKYKHMTLDDRIEIQECLHKGMSFKDIGKRIGKDQTTISKEVKLHAKVQVNGFTKTDEMCPRQDLHRSVYGVLHPRSSFSVPLHVQWRDADGIETRYLRCPRNSISSFPRKYRYERGCVHPYSSTLSERTYLWSSTDNYCIDK